MTMPLVITTRGDSNDDGNSPRGCPEYITNVWSSSILDRYSIVTRY